MGKINVAMFGASGRMGHEVLSVIRENSGLSPSLALSRKSEIIGWKKTSTNWKKEKNLSLLKLNLCVDFSLPESLKDVIIFCKQYRLPLVCGTTGLSTKDFEKIKRLSNSVPVLWSSNMSLGVAIMHQMMKSFSALNGFDFQIEEIHHNKKKDRPSGTALSLQKTLNVATQKANPEPVSIRGGGVFGVHKVFAFSEEEVLTIEHSALNRKVFAKGALTAGAWLIKQKPGLYTIEDMLKKIR